MVRSAGIGGAVACPSCQTFGRGNTGVSLVRIPALALCAALTRPCHALAHASARAVRPLAAGEPLPRALASCSIGSGCPSFGGQRAARPARKALRSRVFGGSLVVKQSCNTKRAHSYRSLTRAVGVGVLRHMNAMHAFVAPAGPVRPGGRPNPSVNRTHNGGGRLFASATMAAPLRSGYLKR